MAESKNTILWIIGCVSFLALVFSMAGVQGDITSEVYSIISTYMFNSSGLWNSTSGKVFLMNNSDKVGIGTNNPQGTLDVAGGITSKNHTFCNSVGTNCFTIGFYSDDTLHIGGDNWADWGLFLNHSSKKIVLGNISKV